MFTPLLAAQGTPIDDHLPALAPLGACHAQESVPASEEKQPSTQNAGEQARILPDARVCRAKNSGLAAYPTYADCLVNDPIECRFALRFGRGHLCQHPERKAIINRSMAR